MDFRPASPVQPPARSDLYERRVDAVAGDLPIVLRLEGVGDGLRPGALEPPGFSFADDRMRTVLERERDPGIVREVAPLDAPRRDADVEVAVPQDEPDGYQMRPAVGPDGRDPDVARLLETRSGFVRNLRSGIFSGVGCKLLLWSKIQFQEIAESIDCFISDLFRIELFFGL